MVTVAIVGFQGSDPLLNTYKNILWVAGPRQIGLAAKQLAVARPQLLVVTVPAVKELWERGVPLPSLRIIIRQR